MSPRSALTRLVAIVAVAVIALGFTLVQGYRPFLGLDLQGGVSVVLRAKAPDQADALSRVNDALTTAGESLGLGPVTVAVDGTTVVITPSTDQSADALEAAQANVEAVVEELGLGDTSVKVVDNTIVVTLDSVGVSDESIDQAISIIRNRVDAIGVAEPEITRQGKNVVVQIPGVKDPDAALALVGQTAELRFRPVLAAFPLEEDGTIATTTTTPSDSTTTTVAGDTTTTAAGDTTTTVAGETTTTTAAPTTTGGAGRSRRAQDTTVPSTDSTVAPTDSTVAPTDSTVAPTDSTDTTVAIDPTTVAPTTFDPGALEPTPDDQDLLDATVILPDQDGTVLYQLGPTLVTGSALSGATAQLNQQGEWEVVVTFRGGADGIDKFNAAAAQCSPPSATCPTGQLAIVLDHEVISAPVIQEPNFDGSAVISGGETGFTEQEAKDLALVLRYGALPVELQAQTTVRVSATLGTDALHAALISGIVAFAAVTLYMLVFYRLLGLLAIGKLVVELSLLWALISYLGESQGLALTLAGITGIIVSIGVSLDSNIVYYEHLKEDILGGRSLRATVDRSFDSAYSTIVKADVASLIGAGLLWWLTVGPVRGFAFYLGISTLLDLICAWFFMHPAVALATRSGLAQRSPRAFGMPDAPLVEGRQGAARARVRRGGDEATVDGGATDPAEEAST